MITQLKFHNFRVLQDATLPLGRVTVIIGPNGSGKSTALEGIKLLANLNVHQGAAWRSVQLTGEASEWDISVDSDQPGGSGILNTNGNLRPNNSEAENELWQVLKSARIFSLDASAIAGASPFQTSFEIAGNGGNLAAVLTSIQDQFPERFDAINDDLRHWMPEFDRIVFETVQSAYRAFSLRTAIGKHRITADRLSEGTLLTVCLLTLSHLPFPPAIIGLEEIDRGIHPRLLRQVQDAVHRLAFPQDHGEDRKPVQVIMTTHSPYFIDLFRDSPENIVIAEKKGMTATFHRLIDMPHMDDILSDISLGDAWYTGILGGVPAGV